MPQGAVVTLGGVGLVQLFWEDGIGGNGDGGSASAARSLFLIHPDWCLHASHKITIGPRKTWVAPPAIVLADAGNGGVGGTGGGGVGAGGVGGASFAVGVGAGGASAASRVSEAMTLDDP